MDGDDGFGPVMRGGPATPGAPPTEDAPPEDAPLEDAPLEAAPRRAHPPDADEGFGPPLKGRAGRARVGAPGPAQRGGRPAGAPDPARPAARAARPRRRRSALRVLLTAVLVLVLLLAGSVVALAAYASARVERIPVGGLQQAPAMNVLVVGSDSREGLTDEEVRDLGTGRVPGRRTDTIFVLSSRGGATAMLSFPRDLYVTRCDGSQGRINAAFASADGPTCLVETVSGTSGIPITHYLELNFLSFVRLVDAVGGVEVCLDQPIRDAAAAVDLPAGCSELDGAGALGFVRVRKIDDDLGRIGRQQYFLQQLARRVASPSTLLDVPRLWSTAGAAGGALIADEDFGTLDLARLGLAVRAMAQGATSTHVVPTTPRTVGGAAVLMPVEGEAEALYARFRDGSILRETPAPAGGTPDGG